MPAAVERGGIIAFLGLYAAATTLWLTIALSSRLRDATPSFRQTALAALLLRGLFLPFDPLLSHDVQRYRWDGLVAVSGVSPYAFPPDAPELAPLRTRWHHLINHPEIATIYPPAAQALFALLGVAGGSLLAWRAMLFAFELAILRMLRGREAWLWATCPFVIIEGCWSAHLEIAAAALLLAATRSAAQRDPMRGAIAAGLAGGVKVVPIAALPALASFAPRRWAFAAIALAALIVPAIPFLAAGALMPGFGEFARRWEFNAPLYEGMRWLVDAAGVDAAAKSLFTSVKTALGAESAAPFVYAQLHPERIARALCALAFLVGLLAAMRRPTIESRVSWSVAALLLASPALHPWYWVVLLPIALEARSSLLVGFALASPASYLLYTGYGWSAAVAMGASYLLPLLAAGVRRSRRPLADRRSGFPVADGPT